MTLPRYNPTSIKRRSDAGINKPFWTENGRLLQILHRWSCSCSSTLYDLCRSSGFLDQIFTLHITPKHKFGTWINRPLFLDFYVYKKLISFISHASFFFLLQIILKDELQEALENAAMPNKNLIIAIINKAYIEPYENEYPSMFDLFLEGFWEGEGTRELLDHLLVVAMDKTAHERCEYRRLNCYRLMADGGGDDFAGEKLYMSGDFIEMMWRRTSFLLNVLEKGYNFIFTVYFLSIIYIFPIWNFFFLNSMICILCHSIEYKNLIWFFNKYNCMLFLTKINDAKSISTINI